MESRRRPQASPRYLTRASRRNQGHVESNQRTTTELVPYGSLANGPRMCQMVPVCVCDAAGGSKGAERFGAETLDAETAVESAIEPGDEHYLGDSDSDDERDEYDSESEECDERQQEGTDNDSIDPESAVESSDSEEFDAVRDEATQEGSDNDNIRRASLRMIPSGRPPSHDRNKGWCSICAKSVSRNLVACAAKHHLTVKELRFVSKVSLFSTGTIGSLLVKAEMLKEDEAPATPPADMKVEKEDHSETLTYAQKFSPARFKKMADPALSAAMNMRCAISLPMGVRLAALCQQKLSKLLLHIVRRQKSGDLFQPPLPAIQVLKTAESADLTDFVLKVRKCGGESRGRQWLDQTLKAVDELCRFNAELRWQADHLKKLIDEDRKFCRKLENRGQTVRRNLRNALEEGMLYKDIATPVEAALERFYSKPDWKQTAPQDLRAILFLDVVVFNGCRTEVCTKVQLERIWNGGKLPIVGYVAKNGHVLYFFPSERAMNCAGHILSLGVDVAPDRFIRRRAERVLHIKIPNMKVYRRKGHQIYAPAVNGTDVDNNATVAAIYYSGFSMFKESCKRRFIVLRKEVGEVVDPEVLDKAIKASCGEAVSAFDY